jgi:hypothetical protein
VGVAPKTAGFEIRLPSLGRHRRDVLFFTQGPSMLLNASVPLDRALAVTGELTERAAFRFIVLDVLRVLKSGRPLANSVATHPQGRQSFRPGDRPTQSPQRSVPWRMELRNPSPEILISGNVISRRVLSSNRLQAKDG